jgi:site-specific DNA-methyltransferase (adenine-specific)
MLDPLQIHCGDCLEILPFHRPESIQCCVTSPPYWGLRDYGTSTWEGGDPECQHSNIRRDHPDAKQETQLGSSRDKIGRQCRFCDAERTDSQLGLESTPDEYVSNMVSVFREVWRVLRDDGTLWLNLGDSYNAYNGGAGPNAGFSKGSAQETERANLSTGFALRTKTLKPKDLCGIPWRVAFALQADGWYLRSDIIWHKPNPMPESVTDRPTKAHEYVFLLTKQERYFYDAEAIREAAIDPIGYSRGGSLARNGDDSFIASNAHRGAIPVSNGFRNKRTVWTIATQPYSEAHFATFPEDLIKPCILAGSRLGDTVLDPFAGSGTTGQVAVDLGRKAILIELNPAYIELIKQRCQTTIGFL